MERLQLTTLAAQNISSPLLAATYTATADKELLIQTYLSGLAGSGVYRACLTKQLNGAGAIYQSATSGIAVSSGVTTVSLLGVPTPVKNGDVVKVYVQGLAGDTSVATNVEVFDVTAMATAGDAPTAEENAAAVRVELATELAHLDDDITSRLAPTVAGRTLDVTDTGTAGIDWGNVGEQDANVVLTYTSIGSASTVGGVGTIYAGDILFEGDNNTLETKIATIIEDTGTTLPAAIADLPTNSEFSTALASADDAMLTAIADVPTVAEFEARSLPSADYVVVGDLSGISGGLTAQETADAVAKLAPTAGAPAAGSVGAYLSTIQGKTDTIGALIITVQSPVNTEGIIRIFGGEDYLLSDARSISFTLTGAPSIAGGSVALHIGGVAYTGVITSATACYVELTAAQTEALKAWNTVHPYELIATLSNGHILTPYTGTLIVD